MTPSLLAALVWALATTGQTFDAPRARADDSSLAQAIRQLGAKRFVEREEASRTLWRAGRAAESALQRAASKSADLEVRRRAKAILDEFRWGVYPETPSEIVALAREFRVGSLEVRREILKRLRQERRFDEALTFVDASHDASVRREFFNAAGAMAAELCAQNDFEGAERLLAKGAEPGMFGWTICRHYAAYLTLRGQASEQIDRLRSASPGGPEPYLLAHLCLINDLPDEALALARQLREEPLVTEALSRKGDWAQIVAEGRIPGDSPVERLGFAAALQGLAGNAAMRDEQLDGLRSAVEENVNSAWPSAEALMLNDEWTSAADILFHQYRDRGLALLIAQGRPAEALRRVGINKPSDAAQWFVERADGLEKEHKNLDESIRLASGVARLLASAGEQADALALLDRMREKIASERGDLHILLAETELAIGERRAEEGLLRALESGHARNIDVFTLLFPANANAASFWWERLRQSEPTRNSFETLERLQAMLAPPSEGATPKDAASAGAANSETAEEEFARLLAQAEQELQAKESAERDQGLQILAETLLAQGRRDEAFERFARLAETPSEDPSIAAERILRMLRAADVAAENKAWSDAAAWYRRAWEADRSQAVPLMLEGWALRSQGDVEGAGERMALARLLPLGDVDHRRRLAEEMEKRGLTEEALEQWRLVWRLGPWHEWEGEQAWAMSRAHRQLGNQASKSAPLTAAEHWRRWLLYLLDSRLAFKKAEHYPQIVCLVHKAQARGLWQSGRQDEALAAAHQALAASVEDLDFIIEVVGWLDVADRKSDAETLFNEAYAVHRQSGEAFPKSARHFNNQAWISARCNRHLDEALAQAKQAVELEPSRAAYVDTLAEVYERRGEKSLALEQARRCVELEPSKAEFQERVARLEKI